MRIVIIGAGITGLSAAKKILEERNSGPATEVVVLEASEHPGGLLKSVYIEGHYCDRGAYLFDTLSEKNFLTEMPELFSPVEDVRYSVWYRKKFVPFPVSVPDTLRAIPFFKKIFLIPIWGMGYMKRRLRVKSKNLRTWFNLRMTSSFYEASGLGQYVYKLMGEKAEKISPLLGEERLNGIDRISSLNQIIWLIITKIFFHGKRDNDVTLYYPKEKGVGSICKSLAQQVEAMGGKIYYGSVVRKIGIDEEKPHKIYYKNGNGVEIRRADYLISTIPLDVLARLIDPPVSMECLKAADALQYRGLIYLFFVIGRESVPGDSAIMYSFEKNDIWKRLVCPSYFCRTMSKPGESCICIEMPVDPGKKVNMEQIFRKVEDSLCNELRLFDQCEIKARYWERANHAYPVYSCGHEGHVRRILDEVQSDRLKSAGRQGCFKYWMTKHCIENAYRVAGDILDSLKNNV